MKQSLIVGIICLFTMAGRTQNVGIGTTTPQSTLDVKGNHRFGGTSAYMSFDTLSGKMIWWNSYLFAPVSQTLMKHSAAADGLFYNNTAPVIGQLEYRNASGSPVFFTNFMSGNGYFKGRLGISAINPLAGLHVGDSSVLFAAPSSLPGSPANTPVSGAGNRMMWYADKASFRAGSVSASNWDKDNIGINSFASGFDTKANGTYSTATGYSTTASEGYATAMGFFTKASGAAATALGNQTTAKAFGSLSVGSLNDNTDTPDPLSINAGDRIFQIGNGYGVSPGNAMTVLRNGNIGIGSLAPGAKLSITADGTELAGTALGNTLKTNAGTLGNATGSEISLANIGFLSGNNSSLGIRAYRATAGTDWTTTALVIGYDVDNTIRAAGGGAGFLALHANGNFGIGTATPQYPLDIHGRMRVSGNYPYTGGIWLNEAGVDRAFVGLQDNTSVGLYGDGGSGWGLTMNTTNGAIAINGNTGSTGQVLQSTGSTSPPVWVKKPYVYSTSTNTSTSFGPVATSIFIPGINGSNFTLDQPSQLVAGFSGNILSNNCGVCGGSFGLVTISIKNAGGSNVIVLRIYYVIQNGETETFSAIQSSNVIAAGTYTIEATATRTSVSRGEIHAGTAEMRLSVEIFPN